MFETVAALRRAIEPELEHASQLSGASFEILVRLRRSEAARLRMADLAAQTGLTASGLTRAIDKLVSAGLVERRSCPTDRRGAYAELTDPGRARVDAALVLHERQLDRILDGVFVDPGAEEALMRALRTLRDRVHPAATSGAGGAGSAGNAAGASSAASPACRRG